MADPNADDLARFWSKVDRRGPDECWPWMGGRFAKGYGVFTINSRAVRAHRWLIGALSDSPLPLGDSRHTVVMHTCDNPPCVNPAHLKVSTQRQNIVDSITKRRHSSVPAKEAEKCRRGHALDNAIRSKDGTRRCRECVNESQRRRRKRV